MMDQLIAIKDKLVSWWNNYTAKPVHYPTPWMKKG